MRNCSKPPSLTVVVQSRSPSRTYRLDVVVHNGGNLDLNFFKSSILSQPLALDPYHLIVPASLCSRVVMMMMMVVVMMTLRLQRRIAQRSPGSSSSPSLPHLVFVLYSPSCKYFNIEVQTLPKNTIRDGCIYQLSTLFTLLTLLTLFTLLSLLPLLILLTMLKPV